MSLTLIKLTPEEVRESVNDMANEIKEDYSDGDDLHDMVFSQVDSAWSNLVFGGMIHDWNASDLVRAAGACATIIQVAEEDAWVADDGGLWEGLTYGVVGSIAFFSLENCVVEKLRSLGM